MDAAAAAQFLEVDESFISSLAPELLAKLNAKAIEYEDLRSSSLMLQVNLEQAEHTALIAGDASNYRLEDALKQLEELRSELNKKTDRIGVLEVEMTTIGSRQGDADGELKLIRSQLEAVQSEKKETVDALQRKIRETAALEEELQLVQERHSQTRRQNLEIENKFQETSSQLMSLKIKESMMTQEVELAKQNLEWADNELKQKSTEFSNYRKEKVAQVSNLQNELDVAIADCSAAQQKADMYNTRLEEINNQLETALLRIKELQDSAISQQESYQAELNSQKRLCELYERSNKEARARINDLTTTVDRQRAQDVEELSRVAVELDAERQKASQAQNHVIELEARIENMQSEIAALQAQKGDSYSALGTLSPSALAITSAKKGGMSLTQLHADFQRVQQELEHERFRNEKLQYEFDDLMREIESRAPEIQEQRAENARMQVEIAQMSELLQEAISSREAAEKLLSSLQLECKDNQREISLQRQQIYDLGRQIGALLQEIQDREAGHTPLTLQEQELLRQITENGDEGIGLSDTDILISERLTVYRNIKELQEQNQNLLKITRELGQRMEREEEETRLRIANLESSAVDDARKAIEGLKEELNTSKLKAESYQRERDMFRRMFTSREKNENIEVSSELDSGVSTKYSDLLRELQTQFDAFRNESLVDTRTLNEQIQTLAGENNRLQIQVAKDQSQLELAAERHRIVTGNIEIVRKENTELRERSIQLQETIARQDVRTQQVAIEVVDMKTANERLQNELNNLQTEKMMWKNVEARLLKENESFSEEKVRLTSLLTTLQAWRSEFETSDSNTKKVHITRIETLEEELRSAKKENLTLSEEIRRLNNQKEVEAREQRDRLDRIQNELHSAREKLASLRASEESLRTQLDETKILLTSAKEKVELLNHQDDNTSNISESKQLALEIAELKSTLNLRTKELQQSKIYAEQLKDISNAAEETVLELTTSYDEYKLSTEKDMDEKAKKISSLQENIDTLNEAVSSHQNEISKILLEEENRRQALMTENEILKGEVAALTSDAERQSSTLMNIMEDLKKQTQICQDSQQNYERELVKHAEAAQALNKIRDEYNNLQTESRKYQNAVEQTEAKLLKSNEIWDLQREAYENEVQELRNRYDELKDHNKLLHSQLENVSQQVSRIDSSANPSHLEANSTTVEKSNDELREIINFLRREKEIGDVQNELSLQENKRQKHLLVQLQNALDETRLSLAQERHKGEELNRSGAQHQELLTKINELNILRESNMALRFENERNAKQSAVFEQQVHELQARIEPLECDARNAKSELEVKDQQFRMLQEDNERWKARTQQILQKYERIDPIELQKLRDELTTMRSQLEKNDENIEAIRREKEDAEARTTEIASSWKARFDKIVEQSKERLAKLRTQVGEAKEELSIKDKELEELREELANAKDEVSNHLDVSTDDATVKMEGLQAENEAVLEQLASLEDEKSQMEAQKEKLEADMAILKTKSAKLIANLKRDLESVKNELANKAQQNYGDSEESINALVNERLELELTERLAAAKAEWEEDKQLAIQEALSEHNVEEMHQTNGEALEEQLRELEARKDEEYRIKIEQIENEHAKLLQAAIAESKAATPNAKAPSKEQIKKFVDKRVAVEVSKAKTLLESEFAAKAEALESEKELDWRERFLAEVEHNDEMEHMRNKVKLSKAEREVKDLKAKLQTFQDLTPSEGIATEANISTNMEESGKVASVQPSDPSATLAKPQKSLLPRMAASGRGAGGRGISRESSIRSRGAGRGQSSAPSLALAGREKPLPAKRSHDESDVAEPSVTANPGSKKRKELKETTEDIE